MKRMNGNQETNWVLGYFAVAFVLLIIEVNTAAAAAIQPGDIVISDDVALAVIQVDPVTGAQTIISSGGNMVFPVGVAIESGGDILVLDRTGAVISVDPVTGAQTVISSGGNFVLPVGIAIDANGDILVADLDAFGGPGGIIRIDPLTGNQTPVSSGGFFSAPTGIAVESSGDIIIADQTSSVPPFDGEGGIIRVDPVTGVQTAVSSGPPFGCPLSTAIEFSGDILAGISPGCNVAGILRVDPVSGSKAFVSSGGFFALPQGIAVEADGNIVVADPNAVGGAGAVIRVDPLTGAQQIVSSGGIFNSPSAIAIFSAPSVITVAIDIKPGSDPNSINPKSKGKIPVAILTTGAFDATNVDETTVLFGATGTEAAPVQSALEDVDGDGNIDMILHFNTRDSGIQCGNPYGFLTGETFSGQAIEGSDFINTVG